MFATDLTRRISDYVGAKIEVGKQVMVIYLLQESFIEQV